MIIAASEGRLDDLIQMHSTGIQWTVDVVNMAAMYDHMNIIQYVFDHMLPWDTNTTFNAAASGNLAILQFTHEHGCEWNEQATAIASRQGHLDCLKYCVEHGCPIGYNSMIQCIQRHNLTVLKYLHSIGCEWNHNCVFDSVIFGSNECFEYLVTNGCPFNVRTIWCQLINTMSNLSLYFTRLPMVKLLVQLGYDIGDQFDFFLKALKSYLTDDILDTEVWLRQFLLSNKQLIPKQKLPVIYRYEDKLRLLKQYAFVEGDNLIPNHVIRYIVCEYL